MVQKGCLSRQSPSPGVVEYARWLPASVSRRICLCCMLCRHVSSCTSAVVLDHESELLLELILMLYSKEFIATAFCLFLRRPCRAPYSTLQNIHSQLFCAQVA